jgi:hypothetical protein
LIGIIEPVDKEILSINISKDRNMFVIEWFISNIIKNTKLILFPQIMGLGLQGCKFLKLDHHIQFFCIKD